MLIWPIFHSISPTIRCDYFSPKLAGKGDKPQVEPANFGDITKIQTKGVAHECLFGRFSILFVLLSGGDKVFQNRPVKGIIGDRIGVGY